jgi:hypothetical protein
LWAATLGCSCFLVRLPSRFVSGPELLLLLVQYVSAAIGPACGLLAGLIRAIANELAPVFGSGAQCLPGFVARTWSIKDTSDRAKT